MTALAEAIQNFHAGRFRIALGKQGQSLRVVRFREFRVQFQRFIELENGLGRVLVPEQVHGAQIVRLDRCLSLWHPGPE